MPKELWQVLREQKDQRGLPCPDCPWIFHNKGKPIRDYRKTWRAACEKIGLNVTLFHDLRRIGERNLVRAGVSERVAMAISGHKTRSVFDRYNIVSVEGLKEAAKKQESYVSHLRRTRVALARAEEIIEETQSE